MMSYYERNVLKTISRLSKKQQEGEKSFLFRSERRALEGNESSQ